MCGSQGRRYGWGPGHVDHSGGWLAAWSTGGGEWSVQGGVSTMRGRTPVRPHAMPPSPCPDHPSPPVAMRERERETIYVLEVRSAYGARLLVITCGKTDFGGIYGRETALRQTGEVADSG